MPAPLKYPNVNWVNGMKIRKEHFIQQENAFDDKLKDVTACFLNGYNYGLLPIWGKEDGSFRMVSKINNQTLNTIWPKKSPYLRGIKTSQGNYSLQKIPPKTSFSGVFAV